MTEELPRAWVAVRLAIGKSRWPFGRARSFIRKTRTGVKARAIYVSARCWFLYPRTPWSTRDTFKVLCKSGQCECRAPAMGGTMDLVRAQFRCGRRKRCAAFSRSTEQHKTSGSVSAGAEAGSSQAERSPRGGVSAKNANSQKSHVHGQELRDERWAPKESVKTRRRHRTNQGPLGEGQDRLSAGEPTHPHLPSKGLPRK